MKILGIVGSPRKEGNTDILVNEVLRGARDVGATTEKIFLNDLDIKPCQSTCSDYCKKTGDCRIKDDMSQLYKKTFDSDVLVLGTPVYWYGPSAQLKAFIDRWYAFSHPEFVEKMKGKKAILVAPFEESDISASDPLVNMISKSMSYLKMKLIRKLLVTAGKKGAVKENLEAMNQAYNIGHELK
jgi:multimeric flavodoxin WrbA